MIRAVIFDCFGVLCSDGKGRIVSFCPSEKRQELQDLYQQVDYGFISDDTFRQQLLKFIGITEKELTNIMSEVYHRNEPLIQFAQSLKINNKIGLLSNVSDVFLDNFFTEQERTNLFDTVVLSSSVGMIKPAAEIYELTAERLGVRPEECIMIDDVQANVEGAEFVGMRGIRFESNEQLISTIEKLLT